MADSDLIKEALAAFEDCESAESHNRQTALEDIRFARLSDQWDERIRRQRETEQRPCLTINRMNSFTRQVVNDARQNKPQIKVHAVDSNADPKTADLINGLIRNIETTSNADVAYDTATECAVNGGFGYFRVGLDYAYEDSFDMDINIGRIANPFSVYGDPYSTAADSSDWDVSFVVNRLSKAQFQRQYKGKAETDFNAPSWSDAGTQWLNEDGVLVAEWWTREEVEIELLRLADGRVYSVEQLKTDPDLAPIVLGLQTGTLQVGGQRMAKSHKVTQRIMTAADILETTDWPGKYIPIIPVYGDEFTIEGKRYFRSLIHDAKDAQRMMNYWRTTSTEMVALAPKVPFIGPEGAFDVDADKWQSINQQTWPYVEYSRDSPAPPQRQPLDMGVAAGALQEALNASDDMKSIIGLFDASLGARSNETSGRAIMARQREGDVATFHFLDNMSRAIRHAGRILIDLIPKVYTSERIVRIIGEDGTPESRQINAPYPAQDDDGNPMTQPRMDANGQPMQDANGNPLMEPILALHDLTSGKYDLTVTTGPSFTTRREEAAMQMTELIRAFPQAAPLIADILARNFDWPQADEIAERLKKLSGEGQLPPEVQQAMQQGQELIQKLQGENESLKADKSIDQEKNRIDWYEAETGRMKAGADIGKTIVEADHPSPTFHRSEQSS